MSGVVRKPSFRVTINGVTLNNVFSVSVKLDFQGRTSSATIEVPVIAANFRQWDIVEISMGASPGTRRPRFRGFFFDIDNSLWPRSVTLNCKGMLALAEYHGNSEVDGTYLGEQTDEDQVTHVLTACGITDMDIRGTGSEIGHVAYEETVWEEGETGLNYIDRLDEVSLGYRTYDSIAGTVVRRRVSPRPGETSILTFTEGVDMLSGGRSRTPQDVKNRVVVEGYSDEFGDVRVVVIQQSPWLPPGVNHITHEFSSALVERIDENDLPHGISARDVAIWQILQHNVLREEIQFETPRDDIIAPGMTITVNSPSRLTTSSRYIVQGVDISINDQNAFTQSVRCVGGDGSLEDVIIDDDGWDDFDEWDWGGPMADFKLMVEREVVLIGGVFEPIYLVYAESTAFGFVADIETLEWSLPGGTPDTGTGDVFVSVLTDLTDKEVTLVATDTNGKIEAMVKTIEQLPDVEKTRMIMTAAETVAEAFDGDRWRVRTPDNSAAVSEVANGPFWLAGQYVYRSDTMLVSQMEKSIPFDDGEGGAVANPSAIWAELDADEQRVMVGGFHGRIAMSTNAAQSWTTYDGPQTNEVVRCVVSRFSPNHQYVLYPDAMWESHDGGITWHRLQEAESGETFRDLNVSFARVMIAVEGGRLLLDAYSGEAQLFGEPE